jgi:4-hydroxybutyrate CoA-transferase
MVSPLRAADPAAAVADIEEGSRVFVGSAAGVPKALVSALAGGRLRRGQLRLVAGYLLEPLPIDGGADIDLTSLQPSPALWATEGVRVSVLPVRYSDYERIFLPGGALPLDVALVQVSGRGPDGRYSLGVSVGATVAAVRWAKRVIAQVNPRMPYTFGSGELAEEEIDVLVEHGEPLLEMVSRTPTEQMLRIAGNAAAEVPDNAVLQLGIGSLPQAVGQLLARRGPFGLHSGMISDWGMLLARGDEPLVSAEAVGTARLYHWLDRNPAVRMGAAAEIHGRGPQSVSGRPFCAVNSALQVDLRGAVNAEAIGGRVLSGPGGLPDFAVAALGSPAGVIIIMVAASTSGRSNIVTHLDVGTPVTLPGWMADRIVTEYGVARLRHLSDRDRVAAVRAIADPRYPAVGQTLGARE